MDRILVAPDSFKGCLGAEEVASILSDEISRILPGCTVVSLPLSDGGEGLAGILGRHLGAEPVQVAVTGPMGNPVTATYVRTGDTAILDVASVCGLSLVPEGRRNPLLSTTRGVGEMLLRIVSDGCRKCLIGLGGSATCDGGEGMMSVPGVSALKGRLELTVLCDVQNPFLGPEGAARVFAPQKGATPEMVEELEGRMAERAARMLRETGVDVSGLPRAGAAGGLGGALYACLGGRLVSGIDTVLDLLHFDEILPGCRLIITGEGKSDAQTLSGKVPMGVLRRSGTVPVVLLSGRIESRAELRDAGFAALIQVTPEGIPLAEALEPSVAERNLRMAVRTL